MSREVRRVPANWEHPKYINPHRGRVYRLRNWVFTSVAPTGDTLDGFDLTSDLGLRLQLWLGE